MIPFDPSALGIYFLLLYALGAAAAFCLLVWWLRQDLSPNVRRSFATRRRSRSLWMLALLAVAAVPVYEVQRFGRISRDVAAQIAQEEAERTPTLAQDTLLAGIAMPAGTKLTLLHHNAVGRQWVKPEYFEQADFPRPVEWQGVSIKQLHRSLQTHQDYSPASFRTTRVTWGRHLETELAGAQTVDGFHCRDTVHWIYEPDGGGHNTDGLIDAALPAQAAYRFDGCALAGQAVDDPSGRFGIRAADGDLLHANRWLLPDAPESHLDTWKISSDTLPTRDFTLQAASMDLHRQQHTLWRLGGRISQGSGHCPLPAGSQIEWQAGEPDVLGVYGAAGIERCGSLRIRPLAHPPV